MGVKGLPTALEIGLQIREVLDAEGERLSKEIDQYEHLEGGLNAFIFNCMKLLKQYDDMIPFLEKTLEYLDNDKNPDLWRILGLLYLAKENDLEKACTAWKKAIELNPQLLEKYSGLNIIYVYEAMKEKEPPPKWKILSIDLDTGNFSVIFE